MTPPFRVESVEGYKAAVIASLVPRVDISVRGIELRLNARSRRVDVVVFRADQVLPSEMTLAVLQDAVARLAAQYDDFTDYTTRVRIEACEETAPLIYRGYPMWERGETRWQLAAGPYELGLLVQAG